MCSRACDCIPCATSQTEANAFLRGLPNPMNCTIAPACCMQVHGPVPVAIPGLDDAKEMQRRCLCQDVKCSFPEIRKDLIPTVSVPDLVIDTNLVEYWSWYPAFWKYTGLCNAKDENFYNAKENCPSQCPPLLECTICSADRCKSSMAIKLDAGKCFLRTPLVDQNYYAPKLYQPHPRKFVNCVNPVFGL